MSEVSPSSSNGAARIVIVDDHPVVRLGLAHLIITHRPGWEICATAAGGQEAIAQATGLRPGIVIVGDTKPACEGLEAARSIQRSLPGVEVLLFSGAQSPRLLLEIFRSSARGCLLKSEPAEELFPALEALRHHHHFRSRGITELCRKIEENAGDLEVLTARETETLQLIAAGRSSKEIAVQLGVSLKTIETHRSNLLRKLKLHSVAELVRYALRNGLIDL